MKELSIEEKAKAYDKALEVLHKYDGANIMFSQSLKEEMFPELAESEDEKVKKSLIRLIKAFYDVNFPTPEGFSRKDLLDWIEKQGKNNIGISKDTKQKLEDNLNMTLEKETQESWNDFLEKQDEQKPWSEEDEQWWKVIAQTPLLTEAALNWIRNLIKRATLQPKQEWSEEDEKNFARVDYACLKVYGGDSYSSDWLRKFLGIHKKWKPSDEQMEILQYLCKHSSHPNEKVIPILESLYQDLKKLKG